MKGNKNIIRNILLNRYKEGQNSIDVNNKSDDNNINLFNSIKIFNHKSNNIQSKIKPNNSGMIRNIDIQKTTLNNSDIKDSDKKIFFMRHKNVLNTSAYFEGKEHNNNSYIDPDKIKRKENHLFSLSPIYFKINSKFKKQTSSSSSNILVYKKQIPYSQKKKFNNNHKNNKNNQSHVVNTNNDKITLNREIDNSTRKIVLLNHWLSKTKNRLLRCRISNNRLRMGESLIVLKNKFRMENLEYNKYLKYYSLKLNTLKEKYIKVSKLNEEIKKEELSFKSKKCFLIEKILEMNILINYYKDLYKTKDDSGKKSQYSFSDSKNEMDYNDMQTDEILSTKNSNVTKMNQFLQNTYNKCPI